MNNTQYLIRKEIFGQLIYDKKTGNTIVAEEIKEFNNQNIVIRDNGVDCSINNNEIGKFETIPVEKDILVGPTYVEIYPTMFCNERCTFCYVGEELIGNPKICMDRTTVDRVVQDLKKLGVFSVTILGGEPLFYNDLKYLVEKLSENNHAVYLSTNGTSQKKELYEFLIEKKVRINLSYHSHLSEIAEKITRNKSAFTLTNKTLDFFLAKKNYFNISLVINEFNYETVLETVKYLATKGVKSMSIYEPQNSGFAKKNDINDNFNKYAIIIEEAQRIAKEHGMKINALSNFWFLADGEKKIESTLSIPKLLYGTMDGRRALYVNYDGNVYPSTYFFGNNKFSLGNVNTEDMVSMWNQSKVLDSIRKAEPATICRSCIHFEYCRGGPITNYSINQIKQEFYCPIVKTETVVVQDD